METLPVELQLMVLDWLPLKVLISLGKTFEKLKLNRLSNLRLVKRWRSDNVKLIHWLIDCNVKGFDQNQFTISFLWKNAMKNDDLYTVKWLQLKRQVVNTIRLRQAAESGALNVFLHLTTSKKNISPSLIEAAIEFDQVNLIKTVYDTKQIKWKLSYFRKAGSHGSLECLKLLVDLWKRKKTESQWSPFSFNCMISSALEEARKRGSLNVVRWILEEVLEQPAQFSDNLPFEAAEYGHIHILQYLYDDHYQEWFRKAHWIPDYRIWCKNSVHFKKVNDWLHQHDL